MRHANRETGAEFGNNWILQCEKDRLQNSHGATSAGQHWRCSTTPPNRTASQGEHAWRLFEPATTLAQLRH